MALTLSLQPDLEAWLEQEANREGISPSQMVIRALDAQRFASAPALARSEHDASLLQRINEGFPEPFWSRLLYLRARLEEETLTEEERREFNVMYAEVEEKNARRMGLLLELAQRRGVTLPEVMEQLGIGPIQIA